MTKFNAVRAASAMGALAASQFAFQPDAAAQPPAAVLWRVQDGGNGHWYRFDARHMNWEVTRLAAMAEGGHLACIGTSSENEFVRDLIPSGDAAYLGAIRIPSGWRWISGEAWRYTNWNSNEPNGSTVNEVVWLERDSGGWNDHTQTYDIQGAVIEWSADCNNDGIVDYGQCRNGSLPDYDGDNVPDCCEQGVPCVTGAFPVEWRASEGGNGHWYRTLRTTTPTNFEFKVGAARSIGAELASIADGDENQFVFTMARASGVFAGRVCIGGRRCDGCPWRWVDGTPWSFEPWGPGEPGNPGDVHVEMFISIGAPGTWADVWDFDGSERAYAVEWSADCDGDGTVDYGQILRGERPDANANGVPDGCECFADLNSDGYVQGADLGLMLSLWGAAPAGTAADVNRDGAVDGNDLGLLLATWGPCGN